jgi:lipoprotein-releasing system permease protein
MYILLLCRRYLQPGRGVVCIISVMLGVATLIVVNSVMGGFSKNLRKRMRGALSDVVIEAPSSEGFADPQELVSRVRGDQFLSRRVKSVAVSLECPAMLRFRPVAEPEISGADDIRREGAITYPMRVVGIDPETYDQLSGFQKHLVHGEERHRSCFAVKGDAGDKSPPNGIILSTMLGSQRDKQGRLPPYALHPGLPVEIATVCGQRSQPVCGRFVVADLVRWETTGYDSTCAFVSLDSLQELLAMPNRITSINMRLKNYRQDKEAVRVALARLFSLDAQRIKTWEDRQAALLQAIAVEEGVLHVLVFFIVGVAGWTILAIFNMLVNEKRRDIGILKSLGASNLGVMAIFLGFGLLLGLIGACLGTALGVALTRNINEIDHWLSGLNGSQVLPRQIYLWTFYFSEIPTHVSWPTILGIDAAAVGIAVLSSVLPAWRAGKMDPVDALRSE